MKEERGRGWFGGGCWGRVVWGLTNEVIHSVFYSPSALVFRGIFPYHAKALSFVILLLSSRSTVAQFIDGVTFDRDGMPSVPAFKVGGQRSWGQGKRSNAT